MEDRKVFEKKNFYDQNDSGVALLFASVLPTVLVLFLVLVAIFLRADAKTLSNEIWYVIISTLLSNGALILTVLFTNMIGEKTFSSTKVKFNLSWKTILICVGIAIVCYFGFVNFINVIDAGLEKIGYASANINIPLTNFGWLVLYLALFAILPAICEELVFRGVIFNGLRKNYSDGFAVVFSGLLFALMHGSISQFIYPFCMGMIFAIIVLRTGNVLCSMLVHMINNAFVIIFSFLETNYAHSILLPTNVLGILLSVVFVALAVVILFLIDKFFFKHKRHEDMQIEKEKNGGLSICMIIGIVVVCFMFAINLVTPFLK